MNSEYYTFSEIEDDDFQGEPCFICGTFHADAETIKDCEELQIEIIKSTI